MRASDSRLVIIIDDDESVRESLPDLVKMLGYSAQAFASAEAFLASDRIDATAALVLDVAMPGMCGPELHRELRRRRVEVPVVYITAQRDPTIRSTLLDMGAVECLFKPFSDTQLLNALDAAFR